MLHRKRHHICNPRQNINKKVKRNTEGQSNISGTPLVTHRSEYNDHFTTPRSGSTMQPRHRHSSTLQSANVRTPQQRHNNTAPPPGKSVYRPRSHLYLPRQHPPEGTPSEEYHYLTDLSSNNSTVQYRPTIPLTQRSPDATESEEDADFGDLYSSHIQNQYRRIIPHIQRSPDATESEEDTDFAYLYNNHIPTSSSALTSSPSAPTSSSALTSSLSSPTSSSALTLPPSAPTSSSALTSSPSAPTSSSALTSSPSAPTSSSALTSSPSAPTSSSSALSSSSSVDTVFTVVPFSVIPTEDRLCPICLDDIYGGEDAGMTPCHHYYHLDCLQHWYTQARRCPMCNANLEHVEVWELDTVPEQCGVCQEMLVNTDVVVTLCNHMYHPACIVEQLETHPRCPQCGREVDMEELREFYPEWFSL